MGAEVEEKFPPAPPAIESMSNRLYQELSHLEASLGRNLDSFENQDLLSLSSRLLEMSAEWTRYLAETVNDSIDDGSDDGSDDALSIASGMDNDADSKEADSTEAGSLQAGSLRSRLERILSIVAHRLQLRMSSSDTDGEDSDPSDSKNGLLASHDREAQYENGYESNDDIDFGDSDHNGGADGFGGGELSNDRCAEIAERLYVAYHTVGLVAIEGPLLHCVAWPRTAKWLNRLADLMVVHAPLHWRSAALAMSPLMRSRNWDVQAIFPRLLDAIAHPSTITPVLDLANFTVHAGLVNEHPAKDRADFLVQLLSGVVARLGMMEEDPTRFGDTPEQIQLVLNDSIALSVALCDAVGLIGVDSAVGKLHQAMELQHRRVQTEAAGALARMNVESGKSGLVKLAAEPIARRRVLTYAEELGFLEKIEDQYTTETALSESDLANWLSDPNQMGFPPHSLEVIDSRSLFWPSYDEPQACFLYRFQYRLPQGDWSNIAMAGPLIHAFSSDLADLPVADIYAAFAGWQAEHSEIFEIAKSDWNAAQRRLAESFVEVFAKNHHEEIEPLWLGFFFGEACLVARSKVENSVGIALTDGHELLWYPSTNRLRPLGPVEVYSIYKGRKMLRSFNSSDAFDEEIDE